MSIDTLKKILLEKANKEQVGYIEELKKLPPEKIIEKSYEKTMRDDIIIAFEYTMLAEEQLQKLIGLEYPVSACFDEWQKRDITYMDRLIDVVEEYSDKLVDEDARQKRMSRNKHEPER